MSVRQHASEASTSRWRGSRAAIDERIGSARAALLDESGWPPSHHPWSYAATCDGDISCRNSSPQAAPRLDKPGAERAAHLDSRHSIVYRVRQKRLTR